MKNNFRTSERWIVGVIMGIATFFHGIVAADDPQLLRPGSIAPDFVLESHNGETVRLSDFVGKQYVVLVFYPGDETPVCTQQLCALRDDMSQFAAKNAKIFGVNPAKSTSHKKFALKHGFTFPLLIDKDNVVTKKYGCAGFPMVKRTVYVIDPQGKIIFAQRGKPDNTVILNAIPAPTKGSDESQLPLPIKMPTAQ